VSAGPAGELAHSVHRARNSATTNPPLVLIHGAGGSRLHWPPELRHLSGADVYAPDLPGHGQSRGKSRSSIEAYAQTVADWLQQLKLPPLIMVGHSMGGAIGQQLALDWPGQLAGLVIIGSGGHLPVNPRLLQLTAAGGDYQQAVELITRWSYSRTADPRLTRLGRQRLSAVAPQVLHDDFGACADFDVRRRLGELRLPVLVMVGSEDHMTPPEMAEALAKAIPGADLALVPGAGHMLMLEQPLAVLELIDSYLKRHFG
jgi:pimeloyl-ACP methyl ester carboxylesterase